MQIMTRSISAMAIVAVAVGLTELVAATQACAQVTKDQLLGSWPVLSFKATTGDKVGYPLGEKPSGFVGITSNRFWVMLVDSTRQPPAAATLTDAEAVAFMKTSAAYTTGKLDIDPAPTPDGIKMTIRVDAAANQALTGTTRILYARVDANKLTLKSPAIVVPATGLTSIVELEFVRAE